ncbi:hypothetical protein [Candidatus Nitrospira bockiana]
MVPSATVMPVPFSSTSRTHLSFGLAVLLAAVLVALAPFGAVLEIHHLLAAADHDGHEHSASDLCQWIQHHTSQSLLSALPVPASRPSGISHTPPAPAALLSARLLSEGHSRAPPSHS